jgi:hypothetical protein
MKYATYVKRENSIYYHPRRRAVGSHTRWGERNPNALSSNLKGERGMTAEDRKSAELPCGYTVAESWAALRKCWLAFYITKSQGDTSQMGEYAKRIRKLQAEMGIKPTHFDSGILDENTALLIDQFYRKSSTQLDEIQNGEESRIENTELNYEEIMTGSNNTDKMPDPRENIFTTHYSSDKSCPTSPTGPLGKIEKKATYYNQTCPNGPLKPAEPTKIQVDRHVTHFKSQCPVPVKQDQKSTDNETYSTAISPEKAKRFLDEATAVSRKILYDNACESIPDSQSASYRSGRDSKLCNTRRQIL